MKESYGEGVVLHTGPESCVYGGNGVCEALTGVLAGRVLSPENSEYDPGADVVLASGRPHHSTDSTRCEWARRGHRPLACKEALCAGSGRSHVWPQGTVVRMENPNGVQP